MFCGKEIPVEDIRFTEMDEEILRKTRFTTKKFWIIPNGFDEVIITSLRIIIHRKKGIINKSRERLDFLYPDLHDIKIHHGTLQIRWIRLIIGIIFLPVFLIGIFLIITSFSRFTGIGFETKTGFKQVPKPGEGTDVSYQELYQAATLARIAQLAYVEGKTLDYTSLPSIHEGFFAEQSPDSIEISEIQDEPKQERIVEKEQFIVEQPSTPLDSPEIQRKTDNEILTEKEEEQMIIEYQPETKITQEHLTSLFPKNYQEDLMKQFQKLDQSDLEVKKTLDWFSLQEEKFNNAEIDEEVFNESINRFESFINRKLKEIDLNFKG